MTGVTRQVRTLVVQRRHIPVQPGRLHLAPLRQHHQVALSKQHHHECETHPAESWHISSNLETPSCASHPSSSRVRYRKPPTRALACVHSSALWQRLYFERNSDFCLNQPTERVVKIYNVIGYLIILLYLLACMYSAPAQWGPWKGTLVGGAYFIFCWFFGGLYLADLLHLGIAH